MTGSIVQSGQAQQKPLLLPVRSAKISNLRYEITFDSTTAAQRTIKVATTFDVSGNDPVVLSLPAWTPGAYEISNFARWVVGFTPTAGDKPLPWDKLDFDTWRIQPGGARSVTVRFDYLADTLDNAMAWSRPDFAFFNGTNLLLYPEGAGTDFSANVTVKTPARLDGGDCHEAAGLTRLLHGRQLSRPGGYAVLCGPNGLRQHPGIRPLDPAGDLSRGALGLPSGKSSGIRSPG